MLRLTTFLCLATATLAFPGSAQLVVSTRPKWADSSARQIIRKYRDTPQTIAPILRQVSGNQSRAKLDEIGDSLVRMAAIDLPVTSRADDNGKTALAAIGTLAESGQAASGQWGGIPYPGAFDRLIRIHREAPATSFVRSAVLPRLIELEPHSRAIAYLRDVATSRDPTAPRAMQALIGEISPATIRYRQATPANRAETETMLRTLWQKALGEPFLGSPSSEGKPSIPNFDAAANLFGFAQRSGWVKQ